MGRILYLKPNGAKLIEGDLGINVNVAQKDAFQEGTEYAQVIVFAGKCYYVYNMDISKLDKAMSLVKDYLVNGYTDLRCLGLPRIRELSPKYEISTEALEMADATEQKTLEENPYRKLFES